jgi:hypothetical protein
MYYQNQRLELLSLEVNSGTSGPAVEGRVSGVLLRIKSGIKLQKETHLVFDLVKKSLVLIRNKS